MLRPRTPSAPTLIAGSLLAGTVMFFAFVTASSTTTGCSTQEVTPAPDAAAPPCEEGPFTFCQVAAPGEEACNTDVGTAPELARLPRATNYPVGCVINFVGPRDEQGDCRLESVCKCVIGQLPSTQPDSGASPDAGEQDDGGAPADAGDDAEAGAQPTPTPTPTPSGPVWLCE